MMIRSRSLEVPYQTAFSNGSHDGLADVPVDKGGAGKGFGPHELLEAAFATCLTMTVQMYAAKHEFPLHAAHCEVRLDRSLPEAAALDYTLTFSGPLSADQTARLWEAARRCPVARTLTGTIALRPVASAEQGQ